MNERWVMNRIGFVNFWLYDVEEFPFENGKLLLRGQNASGKSITTQSFIPFILDGDRNPSRLDPFGSSDRKMEYYFLGEDGQKEEATGYLYLEFRKKGREEYRTIAVGQRARRGRPMDFWGFVILDGRRVGYDLLLYRDAGSSRIPLGKNEARKLIGDGNPFTDTPGEYKKLVNKYLFGFVREEQYEQFIRLLVQVRSPKLSKEFKPTRIYEILNDSLQTLTDEDLRPMVDAMEKMDSIQESLEQMNRALGDVKAIRTEYLRYNQYMLGKKAGAYLEAQEAARKVQQKLEQQGRNIQALRTEFEGKTAARTEMLERLKLIQTELASMLDTDLEEIDTKLEKCRSDREEQMLQEENISGRIERNRETIRELDARIRDLKSEADGQKECICEGIRELQEIQEVLLWQEHEKGKEILEKEAVAEAGVVREKLLHYQKEILAAKRAVEEYEQVQKRYDETAQKTDIQRAVLGEAEVKKEYEQQKTEQLREQTAALLYQKNSANKEWILSKEQLSQAEKIIQEYEYSGDGRKLDKLFADAYMGRRSEQNVQLKQQERAQKEHQDTMEELKLCLETLKKKQELHPDRRQSVENSRKYLEQMGIKAIPFYMAVDFSENLQEKERARLEEQLSDLGILDALVVSEQDFQRIRVEFPKMTDRVLRPQTLNGKKFEFLRAEEGLEEEIQKAVLDILCHFTEVPGEEEPRFFVAPDGGYGYGILCGRSEQKEFAEYIGSSARKRKKEQEMKALEEEIGLETEQIQGISIKIADIKKGIAVLEEEYHQALSTENLETQLSAERAAAMRCEVEERNFRILEKELGMIEAKRMQIYQNMLMLCKLLPYGRTTAEYEQAAEAVAEYIEEWIGLSDALKELEKVQSFLLSCQDGIDRLEGDNDDLDADRRKVRLRIRELVQQIEQYEAYLNNPEILERVEHMETLKKEKRELDLQERELDKRLSVISNDLDFLLSQKEEWQKDYVEMTEKETLLREYFEEEMSLELLFKRSDKTLENCAKEALGLLRKADESRDAASMVASLHQSFTAHSGNLVSYHTSLEETFEEAKPGLFALRKRFRISSAWNGKKVYLEELYNILRGVIENTSLLIQEKDRELFEDILSKTISHQLTDRIAESRKWVQDMSLLMKLDTSMGLYFTLDWKPRSAENEQEMDIKELEKILLRDRELLTDEDIERVASHFRSRIQTEKRMTEERGLPVNYMDLVRDALDYRKWFMFRMFYHRGEEGKRPLTNSAFNKFSGGEKAMAMYAPLFAAVNAQYKKARNSDHPRVIALDEAFAGVDDKNINTMFSLVESMDFDYIMNSQSLWGCFRSVPGLHISELRRPMNSQTVSVIHYTWNGQERCLDEQ